jgi:hypothetical protein
MDVDNKNGLRQEEVFVCLPFSSAFLGRLGMNRTSTSSSETARRFDVREIGGCLALLCILEYRKELKCQSESIRASIT